MLLSFWSLLLIFCAIIQVAQGACMIPPYIRDTWLFDGQPETRIRFRDHQVIYKSPAIGRKVYECTEQDNMVMLLRLIKSPNANNERYVCILVSDMMDIGLYTIERLNGFDTEGTVNQDIMTPQFVNSTDVSIESFCKTDSNTQMVFIKRKVPGCRFFRDMIGSWNTSLPGILSVEVTDNNVILHTESPVNISMMFDCYSKDYHRFLLRFSNGTRETGDPYLCTRIAYIPRYKHYRLLILEHGNLFHRLLKIARHLQPLHLHIDCEWDGHTYAKFHLFRQRTPAGV